MENISKGKTPLDLHLKKPESLLLSIEEINKKLSNHGKRISVLEKSRGSKKPEKIPKEINYWLSPVSSKEGISAEEVIQKLVVEEGIYAYGKRTPGRKFIKPGDWICFYATGKGAIAHARVLSRPEYNPHPRVKNSEKYPYTFKVDEATLYLDNPKFLNLEIRKKMDYFQGKNPEYRWGFILQATRKVTPHDFKLIIRE